MSIRRRMRLPAVIVEYGPGDANKYGSKPRKVLSEQTLKVHIEDIDSTEVLVDRDLVTATQRGFLPPGAVLSAQSQIIAGGRTYEVVGEPKALVAPRSPTTVRFFEVHLRTTRG